MGTRRDLTTLSSSEKKAFLDALIELKKSGIYDQFVEDHNDAMAQRTTLPGEIPHTSVRNAAHRGPAFLPWHREYLRRFELALQAVDSSVSLPYWDWSADAALADPTTADIWKDDFLGGNGDPADGNRVKTGRLAFANGEWPLRADLGGPALQRQFATLVPDLPTAAHVGNALRQSYYDTAPYDRSPYTRGFRNYVEGWVNGNVDGRFSDTRSQLHNRVHLWVGGSMLPGTSPNDPAFYLHHCFVDKIWADWQERVRLGIPELAPHYFPIDDGPEGHNLYDPMYPWAGSATPASVLDNEAIGVDYVDKPDPVSPPTPAIAAALDAAVDSPRALAETDTALKSPYEL